MSRLHALEVIDETLGQAVTSGWLAEGTSKSYI